MLAWLWYLDTSLAEKVKQGYWLQLFVFVAGIKKKVKNWPLAAAESIWTYYFVDIFACKQQQRQQRQQQRRHRHLQTKSNGLHLFYHHHSLHSSNLSFHQSLSILCPSCTAYTSVVITITTIITIIRSGARVEALLLPPPLIRERERGLHHRHTWVSEVLVLVNNSH